MARGRTGKNVELRAKDIRVRFTLDGVRQYVTLDWAPTVAHEKAARRLMSKVKAAIDAGTFNWNDFFPDSAQAKTSEGTLKDYGQRFLDAKSKLAAATRDQYENALEAWYARKLRNKPLGEWHPGAIQHSELAAMVGKVGFPSARSLNNALIPLRGAFDMWAKDDRRHRVTPLDGVENQRFQKGKPDPLTPEQAEAVIKRAYEKYGVAVGAYFEFAVFAWVRPEEQIAIRWDRVDFAERTVRIDRVRTFRGLEKDVKTYEERDIECNDRAWAALMKMRPLTQLKPHEHVFEHPETGKPWHDERAQRDTYWKPILKALGIRARRAYCTRHTGITLALSAGCDPSWVARQAGHKNTKMIWENYSKWIPGVDRGRERGKMSKVFAQEAA